MFIKIQDEQARPSVISVILRELHLDIPLFIALLFACVFSFLILYSASGQNVALLTQQAIRVGLAFVLMIIIAHINPRYFYHYSVILYGLGILLLIAVLVMGLVAKGAQRWMDLGLFNFQPSEIIKIVLPMMVAWFLSGHALPPNYKQLALVIGMIALPTFLIAKQPDLGTALLISMSGIYVLFFAGLSWRFMVTTGVILTLLTPILWYFMHDYQKSRVLMLLNPETDPMGRGYHIIQSKIAIGSGGIYGKGWLGSTQSNLNFLPESSTDFIFAVFAEEFGLLGCIGLLTLYLLIIGRCLYIAVQAQDTYSRLLAGSLTLTFFSYVSVNVGMVIGVLPVVGVSLPLISYGGTSIVTLLIGFGILMSIHAHKRFLPA